ncbi:aldehyde dehydrogenase family protein [Aquisediminimonas sediminicola]|uniref:aldehyde dehydrogenase family protein n=1 Tax=Alteraquisediminimonas sediminicola TaxID=2676787 RepID=UPI0031B88392
MTDNMGTLLNLPMMIDGKSVTSAQTIAVINPATEQVIGHVPDCTRAQLDEAVAAARKAFPAWRATPYAERQQVLHEISRVLAENAEELADILMTEQGKPRADALGEIHAASWWIVQVAQQELPVEVTDEMPGQRSITRHVPLGVVGAITPWNFPVVLGIWKIGPALLTGNTMVLKPSPFTPLSTLRLGELLQPILPSGVLNLVTGGDALGPWMTEHPGIDKISFTGSTATGRRVMASAAGNLKRLTLELGGNDAAIVLDDADVEAIAEPLFWAAFKNSGQICVATKRMYVHDSIYDDVAKALTRIAAEVQMGNGADPASRLGPIQNRVQFERVKSLVEDAKAQGLRFLTGGEVQGPGFFVPVTIIDNPPESSRVVQEEAFGPVLPLLRYTDIDEVIARANDVDMGLGGSIWSTNHDRAMEIAARLETGTVWINAAQALTPYAAFAGHKQSGLGIEQGLSGILEFTVPQTIHHAR